MRGEVSYIVHVHVSLRWHSETCASEFDARRHNAPLDGKHRASKTRCIESNEAQKQVDVRGRDFAGARDSNGVRVRAQRRTQSTLLRQILGDWLCHTCCMTCQDLASMMILRGRDTRLSRNFGRLCKSGVEVRLNGSHAVCLQLFGSKRPARQRCQDSLLTPKSSPAKIDHCHDRPRLSGSIRAVITGARYQHRNDI
jgi:hypothetical protein